MVLEWFFPAILLALGIWVVLIHRRLSGMRREAIVTWEPLEQVLRQRHDLVAPLVQTVLAHAPKARSHTDAMIQARKVALNAELSPQAAGEVETRLAVAMRRVLTLATTHPELATDLTFRRIQARFEQLGGEIAAAQDAFNEAALLYNREAISVPAILVAKYAKLPPLEHFGLDRGEREGMHEAALTRRP